MAVGFVASASSGSQASVASFNIGTLGTGARAGIVFVCTHNSSTDIVTGVTWNGAAMTFLYSATDTDTEPGRVEAYFLDNVTNGTITVSRTNNATVTVGYAASISAATATEVTQVITRVSSTQNTDADTSTTGTGTSGEVAVDDGSPGTNSMRFAAAYSGAATPPANGTNSTNLQLLDSTAFGSRFVRETTAGQGSRNVGFATGTTDDWAFVGVAVSEVPPPATNAPAERATSTGAALAATTTIVTNAGISTATGAALNATGQVSKLVDAGLASATGAAGNATTLVSPVVNVATATGEARQPAASVAPNAGVATASGVALDATVEVTSGTNADAEFATATGAANLASTSVQASAGVASATGAALDAAVTVSEPTNVDAGIAAAIAAAYNATTTSTGPVNVAAAIAIAFAQAHDASITTIQGGGARRGPTHLTYIDDDIVLAETDEAMYPWTS
jgi:hypothetical protein